MDEMLKPCPFCGGEAVLMDGRIYCYETKFVSCTICHAKTVPVVINFPNVSVNGVDESTRYTAEQAGQKACELWNARATPKNSEHLEAVIACREADLREGKNCDTCKYCECSCIVSPCWSCCWGFGDSPDLLLWEPRGSTDA